MTQDHDETENKTYADVVAGDDVGEIVNGGTKNGYRKPDSVEKDEDLKSLYSLICLTIGSILFPDSKTGDASSSFLERVRNSVAENGPKLREASERTGREILLWTRRGSSLRALLVITMGTIVLLTTMALVVFTLFFVAATANAIIISLLISLAVAGGFLALFFLCLTGVYIGALSVAAFVISTATISAVVSVLIASGWIGFFYVVWLGTRGSLRLAKQSVSVVGSAISGNTFSRHQHQDREVNIESSN
ncbi:unnamed protein product [Arabidopsis lyrata]|uniref:Uncharacterized protein n=1 Tax=Arabidopsis lyrata subsp. lyrata TaxID=81972 RepID=D7M860_ARALL|nr:uncharacterized protein LOC9309851 [Arabidopsis lyrata subsp. lyrata]EFH47983.1 hypothetical protein ARALYDRAFT_488513 [Arabidopsis lyrata subsp. lyrata]CAH8271297.1 unnamed protein product [Arabidopsis lyrata]|eukprot:XP_020878079.1 uncharacterized protein LOC9309851 [Arabidopsis lyrata subsp. lyrata]